jgi:Spy/CpxP family protein refolding chaperone
MNPTSRNAIIAYVAATFVAGAVAGGFVARSMESKPPPRTHRQEGGMARRMLEKFTRELSLNPAQIEQLRPIFDNTEAELGAIHKDTGRRMKQVFEQTNARIRPILDADQKRRFEEFLARMERKMAEQHRDHPPVPPRPESAPPSVR